MNAWNARSAMSGNKRSILKNAALAALLLTPGFAHAQGSAPAMFGVKEVLIQYARFSNPKTADACSLSREDLARAIDKVLTENNIPALTATDAKPPMMGAARIELIPELSTINNGSLDCTSWVSLTAETRNNLRIPPVDTPRSVTVTYWHQGAIIASEHSGHEGLAEDILKKMALQFAQQYRLDQPPEVPPGQ